MSEDCSLFGHPADAPGADLHRAASPMDTGSPPSPSAGSSTDEVGPPPSRAASPQGTGVSGLIHTLRRQNLWPEAAVANRDPDHTSQSQYPSRAPMGDSQPSQEIHSRERQGIAAPSASAPAPVHKDDVTMVVVDGKSQRMVDLQGLTRQQHALLARRHGLRDRAEIILESMLARADQCNVRRRCSLLRPTTTEPSSNVAASSSSSAPPASANASANGTTAATAPCRPESHPTAPGPSPALRVAVDSAPIEADEEEAGDEAFLQWQKGCETAALLRSAKIPAGIRKTGRTRFHYSSQEVALRCPNVVLSKPRMRKRKKPTPDGGGPGDAGPSCATPPISEPSSAVSATTT